MLPFADNFLAGSLLSLLLPVGLLIALAIWLGRTIARLPSDPGTTAAPPPERDPGPARRGPGADRHRERRPLIEQAPASRPAACDRRRLGPLDRRSDCAARS